jgi:hypothetical protein
MGGPRCWWDTRWFAVIAVLLTAVPLLAPPIPPLVDLLGHMARYRIELGHSPWLEQYYSFSWTPTGNLGVDGLAMLLAPLVGLEPAVKLIIITIPLLAAAGFLWVGREAHGRIEPTAMLALPFVYGQPFLYGFVNFSLSMALAFLTLGLWLRLGRAGRTGLRAILFVPISILVFFAHAFGWGALGLMAWSAETVRQHDRGLGWPRASTQAACHAASLAVPLAIMVAWRGSAQGPWAWAWFDWQAKLVWVESALRDRWQLFDLLSMAAIAATIVLALRSARTTFARTLVLPAAALLVAFLILPTNLFGSAYADMRLVPYIVALLLLAIGFPGDCGARTARVAAALSAAFLVARIGANTLSLAQAAADQGPKLLAVGQVPIGARVVSFVQIACGGAWPLQRNSHLGALVTIRRQGFANDQWVIEGASGLGVRYRAAGDFAADPSQLVIPNGCSDGVHRTADDVLASFPRQAFDFVWLIDIPAPDPRRTGGLELVWRGGGSALYRITR